MLKCPDDVYINIFLKSTFHIRKPVNLQLFIVLGVNAVTPGHNIDVSNDVLERYNYCNELWVFGLRK